MRAQVGAGTQARRAAPTFAETPPTPSSRPEQIITEGDDPRSGGTLCSMLAADGADFNRSANNSSYAIVFLGDDYFSQSTLISISSGLNSGSPVTSSAFLSFARAAAKASAKLILNLAFKSAAMSASTLVVE